jgi:hypothetical protein
MGSVLNHIDCPKCGYEEATSDYYYNSGEEYIFCSKCGYHLSHEIIREDIDNPTENDVGGYKQDEGGGFGAYRIMFDGGGSLGSFKTEEDIKEFEKGIIEQYEKGELKNGNNQMPTEIIITYKKEDVWFVKDLITKQEYEFTKKEVLDKLKR